MSSVRGRGIVRAKPGAVKINTALGLENAPARWQSPLDSLAIKVAVLDSNYPEQLQEIEEVIRKYCIDVEKMRLLVDDLHERSLADAAFGARAATALATAGLLVVEGVKLRTLLIQNLQNDFNGCDQLREENKHRYLNSIIFLNEVFQQVRLADNLPIAVLGLAHFLYQKKLLLGETDELELFVKLLAQQGHTLLSTHPTELEDLMVSTHSTLISRESIGKVSRAWLLVAIHMHNHGFVPIVKHYVDLFEMTLGKEALSLIQQLLSTSEQSVAVDNIAKLKISSESNGGSDKSERQGHGGGEKGSVFSRLGPRKNDDRRPGRNPPRDSRMDSNNWLPIPQPSAADVSNWGLEVGGGRRNDTGHDDRCERNYDDDGRNVQSRGDYHKGGSKISQASKQALPDEESWD